MQDEIVVMRVDGPLNRPDYRAAREEALWAPD